MIQSADSQALWLKAKLFVNRAMDLEEYGRSFDEQAFWSSAALELLGKAALSRQSPALIAAPSESGKSILAATGLISLDKQIVFATAPAKMIFERCSMAFKPFNKEETAEIARARNEYIHGGAIGFGEFYPHTWWPKFWAQAVILIQACDSTLDRFVGIDRAYKVEEYLEKNEQIITNRASSLVQRARQRFEFFQTGRMSYQERLLWENERPEPYSLKYNAEASCPACSYLGLIEGEDSVDIRTDAIRIAQDEWEHVGIGVISADHFICPQCHLELEDWKLVRAAGLDESFEVEGDEFLDDEEEYGND